MRLLPISGSPLSLPGELAGFGQFGPGSQCWSAIHGQFIADNNPLAPRQDCSPARIDRSCRRWWRSSIRATRSWTETRIVVTGHRPGRGRGFAGIHRVAAQAGSQIAVPVRAGQLNPGWERSRQAHGPRRDLQMRVRRATTGQRAAPDLVALLAASRRHYPWRCPLRALRRPGRAGATLKDCQHVERPDGRRLVSKQPELSDPQLFVAVQDLHR